MKPLSGKRWFYSMGVRSMSPDYIGPTPTRDWPHWARRSFMIGQDDERFSRARATAKLYPISKLLETAG